MAGTTNRVSFEEAADLLTSARACVACVVDGAPRVVPAVVRHVDSRFLVGVTEASVPDGLDEAVLVIDEGVLFFDLRAIYVRGRPGPVDEPPDPGRFWFEVEPATVTCWDYGRLRNVDGSD